ncbi:recombinase family protein [Xenorhabdus eapokensis]|uniref:recombinase family protein n=1 Tax=Xenorhabdus eapokensis TaxID=1873482 RepID=UPI003CC687D4
MSKAGRYGGTYAHRDIAFEFAFWISAAFKLYLFGYTRVSKSDGSQVQDLQLDALLAVGVNKENIYQDEISGKSDKRPGLDACLKALRPGDVLMVWKLDRLGRSLKHLVNTISRQALYKYVGPDGELREHGERVLKS